MLSKTTIGLHKGSSFHRKMPRYLFFLLCLLFITALLPNSSNSVLAQSTGATCNCKEYIYLNEPLIGSVLKFEVGATIPLQEVVGANGGTPPAHHWYPGTTTSQLPAPHGLATDLNGRLYVAAQTLPGPNGVIRRFDCDGRIEDSTSYKIPIQQGDLFNMFSIGNTLYATRNGGIDAYNTCNGQKIGEVCFNGADGNPVTPAGHWGLSYNTETEMVYATRVPKASGIEIWAFSKAELEAAIIPGGPCINPIISAKDTAPIMPGSNYFPTGVFDQLRGIVGDDAGNIYVVALDRAITQQGRIFKYNSKGQFVTMSGPIVFPVGITWSRTYNRLFTTQYVDRTDVDCISAWDAKNLNYLGTAVPNPGLPSNNTAKAIAILKECCPTNLPATFTRNVCGGVGTKFYLNQEAFSSCDGVVCGSSWTPVGTPTGMTFDPCDNSVTITGEGCATFTLNIGAVSSTSCPAKSSTFTICNTLLPPPDAGPNVTICLPKTTVDLTDAPSGYEWVTVVAPSGITLNPTNGQITGLSSAGTYRFRLQSKLIPDGCSDDVLVNVTEGDAPVVLCNDGTTSYTLTAQAGLTDIVWYNMAGQQVGTGANLIVTSNTSGLADGSEAFYYTSKNSSNCNAESCCPVKFITQNCCPTPNCVSITIIKN